MGKPTVKKKLQSGVDKVIKLSKLVSSDRPSKHVDEDTAFFIQMSQELKEEGNKLFQKHDSEGAMLKYEKAVKLLPKNHIDVANLRSKMASCYMQLGLKEHPKAIDECNLAFEVARKYRKALVNRAKCYYVLNKFDLALRDVMSVLTMEPNNLAALEIESSVKKAIEGNELKDKDDNQDIGVIEYVEDKVKKTDDEKVVVINETSIKEEKLVTKTVKMVLGDDIRWAELPVNCSIGLVREIIRDRFPGLNGVLMKYKDGEGDLITVLTTDELRLAEKSGENQGCFRLYLVEVGLDKEPCYEGLESRQLSNPDTLKSSYSKNVNMEKPEGKEEWIVQFARLFKNHVGFDTNLYLDLHEIGMELYYEALEDSVINENSQNLFNIAEDESQELVENKVKFAYEWAQKEYIKAGKRYEESLKIKPNFYEGHLALGMQQFERAKLTWHYTIGSKADLEGPSIKFLELYNKAEDNMEKGMQIWEELEEQRLNGLSLFDKHKVELINAGLEGMVKNVSSDEAAEEAVNIRSQIIFYGFELAGASPTDITVIIKNHCSNGTALEGLNFKIDEIVQAWNEMFDTKRRPTGVPLFRLEPLFRRRVSKLHSLMEHF
ncbi:hypothetical protein R6Q57_023667 [Mikania cordata]